MHIHLPKPLHGWREFVGEVGIIVVGVLIALGAEQVVETIHLGSETHALRASMWNELGNDRARWEITHAEYPCLRNWVAEMQQWTRTAPAGAMLAHAPSFALWNTHVSTWEMARGSRSVASMPLAERDALADLYQALERQERAIERAVEDWDNVLALAEAADVPENRRALPLAIIKSRQSVTQLETAYNYLEPRFQALDVAANYGGLQMRGSNGVTRFPTAAHCPSATNEPSMH